MAQQIISSNTFTTAKWIVSATSSDGTHTTIASALTSASSGDTIFIRTGTFTENITLKAGVNLTAYESDSSINGTGKVIISGTCTMTTAGSVTISGIQLQTNSATFLAVTGSNESVVNLLNCYLNCLNNTGISYTSSNSASTINIISCQGNIATTGITLFTCSSSGTINTFNSEISNTGVSTTQSTSTSTATLSFQHSYFQFPFSLTTSTSLLGSRFSTFDCNDINSTAISQTGTNSIALDACILLSGTASCLSTGAGCTSLLYSCILSSSNTNAATGSGTLTYANLSFRNTSSVINTTTQTANITRPGITRSAHQPAFSAYNSASDADKTGDGTSYTVLCDTEIFDQDNEYNTGTGTYTATYTGVYVFCANTLVQQSTAAMNGIIQISTSNRNYNANTLSVCNVGNQAMSGTFVVDMDAADTAVMNVSFGGSTKTADIYGGTDMRTSFGGYLLG